MTLYIVDMAPLSKEGDRLFCKLTDVVNQAGLDEAKTISACAMFCASVVLEMEKINKGAEEFFFSLVKKSLASLKDCE